MQDERDLSEQKKWYYTCLAEKAVANLKKNRIEAVFAVDRRDAVEKVLDMIPEGSVIGFADSVTLEQIGIFDHLESRKPAKILRPIQWDTNGTILLPRDERSRIQRQVLTSDVYICGVNAVTLDGKLLSTDGLGNRVAPMIYGPKRTIIVAGVNKIVPDVEAAHDRIRKICAPMNARRHFEKHHISRFGELPCVKTGYCVDCKSPHRSCHFTVIIDGSSNAPPESDEELKRVVIVGEDLGI